MKLCVWDTRNADGITREKRTHQVNIGSNIQPLKITLVWADPPGIASSATPAINNLDLEVISADGSQRFRGIKLNGGVSVQGGVADAINNVEMVLVDKPQLGNWTIMVLGTAVNVGNPGQGYALVVTADLCSRLAPISLKQFASESGMSTPFSVRLNLLPALSVNADQTVSLVKLICERGQIII